MRADLRRARRSRCLRAAARSPTPSLRSKYACTSQRPRRNRPLGFAPMREPTKEDVDALVGPAKPHFAYQLRARVEELIRGLPDGHPVKAYGREKMELLDRLGLASSKAEEGGREPRSRIGWNEIPSSAPAYDPLPRRQLRSRAAR